MLAIGRPQFLHFSNFIFDPLVLSIVNHLVQKLLLSHFRAFRTFHIGEETLHQVLIGLIQLADMQVDHIVVLNFIVGDDLLLIVFKHLLSIVEHLLWAGNLRCNFDVAFQFFNWAFRVHLDVVKFIVVAQILNEQIQDG